MLCVVAALMDLPTKLEGLFPQLWSFIYLVRTAIVIGEL